MKSRVRAISRRVNYHPNDRATRRDFTFQLRRNFLLLRNSDSVPAVSINLIHNDDERDERTRRHIAPRACLNARAAALDRETVREQVHELNTY